MSAPLDITGMKFDRLTAIKLAGTRRTPCGSYKRSWHCVCDCGNPTVVDTNALRQGLTRSCGCILSEVLKTCSRTHGHTVGRTRSGCQSPTYRTWSAMRTRCTNPNQKTWKNYGGRGIKICRRWRKFANFLADMGPRPPGMTIERIKNNDNYRPGNCRWAAKAEQARNSRANRIITVNGKTLILAEWAELLGLSSGVITARLRRGWTEAKAVTTPLTDRGTSHRK